MAGEVKVDGVRAVKPATIVNRDVSIEIVQPMPYVSRGGYKLAAGLDAFGLDVEGKVCADVGACTGGFTDVLLQRRALRVYAIDVGYGQLAWKLRNDSRVIILERTNARYLESLGELVEFVCIDVSFISVKLILPSVLSWLQSGGDIVVLIKPQFEAGRELVSKGGVIRDPQIHKDVLSNVLSWCHDKRIFPQDLMKSPITGGDGNQEFLAWLKPDGNQNSDIRQIIDEVTK